MSRLLYLLLVCVCGARELHIDAFGASPGNDADSVANAASINWALGNATNGDSVIVPVGTWKSTGGLHLASSTNVTLKIQGVLLADDDRKKWPLVSNGKGYVDFLTVENAHGFTLDGGGTLDGQGKSWWNEFVNPTVHHKLHRPTLVHLMSCTDIVVEHLTMRNSPSFHLQLGDALRARIAFVTVTVDRDSMREAKSRRASQAGRGFGPGLEPEDLNTDGIDPSGRDIHIHDCSIQNDDDSIAVKPCGGGCPNSADPTKNPAQCTRNLLIENTVLTGFGASIGSVPPKSWPNPNCISNVTFRNISMPGTGKGQPVPNPPHPCSRK